MDYTSENIGSTPLDEFIRAIPNIYSEKDKFRSLWDVWLHTNHHASAIGEEVRKGGNQQKFYSEIADFAMWFFTFIGKLEGVVSESNQDGESPQESLIRIGCMYSDVVWKKYPNICPVCYWRRSNGDRAREQDEGFDSHCNCLMYEIESRDQTQKETHVKALREFALDTRGSMPSTVDQWQEMFTNIFQANQRHLTLADIAFHLLEEMGEVSDAIARMYTFEGRRIEDGKPSWAQIWLEEELADVSSWLFALVGKMDVIRKTADTYDRWLYEQNVHEERRPIRLSEIIWKRYGSDDMKAFYCSKCRNKICMCEIIIVPGTHPVEELLDAITDVLSS